MLQSLFSHMFLLASTLAVLSLMTPKTVFFLNEPTRKKGFSLWLFIAAASLLLFSFVYSGLQNDL